MSIFIKEFFTSLKNYEFKLTEQSAYEIALWIESNEKHLSALQQNNFTKYSLGEILLVDLGWNNYDREFAYIHPAIVIKETATKIFIVPCSSGNPRKDKKEIYKILASITEEFVDTAKTVVPNGNVQVIRNAKEPQKQISPNIKINIVIGILSGVLLGGIIVFIKEFKGGSIETKEEVEEKIGIPVLGTIPKNYKDKWKWKGVNTHGG